MYQLDSHWISTLSGDLFKETNRICDSLLCSSHEEKEIPVGDVVDISFLVSCMRFYLLLNQRDQEYAS